MFFLAYHLHWEADSVMALPTADRWGYVELLSEQLERENEAVEKARS